MALDRLSKYPYCAMYGHLSLSWILSDFYEKLWPTNAQYIVEGNWPYLFSFTSQRNRTLLKLKHKDQIHLAINNLHHFTANILHMIIKHIKNY